jgi:hypothetical protein
MQELGKLLISAGIVAVICGVIFYFFGKNLLWIGNLPGDIKVEKENFKFYFPLTTMILFSLVINLLIRLWKYFF